MEDSEMADCAENIKSAPEEVSTVISENCVSSKKISTEHENTESNVSKSAHFNDNSNSDSEKSDNSEVESSDSKESFLSEKASQSPEVESYQHTFKKPGLLTGHRKGKHTKLRVHSPTDPCHSIVPAEWFLEMSETVEGPEEAVDAHISAKNGKESESKVSKEEKTEKTEKEEIQEKDIADIEKENVLKIEKDKQLKLELEQQLKIEKKKQMKLEKEIQIKKEKEKQIPLPYKEPSWSGKPDKEYRAEILKSGLILEVIDLSKRNFYVVGRLPSCDISLAHPTISRYHAVIQFRSESDDKNDKGLYLYDLGSTHGTFWNGNRIRPNVYVRIRGGHMIKFGNSQRKFIMQTPPEEVEEESELSVSELKEKRRLELEERTKIELERQKEEELEEKLRLEKEEKEGVDWGMGEDADEESDLTENPYAQTNNEELFLDDPKKTLRGWFEREGHDLQYQTEEKGIGRFTCWVDLPIEDYIGRTIRGEATVKGKKKEAVVQCALEACRILDRYGLLRQAAHESRKRKSRNWEEQDFYDSDEDNFLDRTGSVEKKRERRMKIAGKLESKAENYTSLTEKHTELMMQIKNIESRLEKAQNAQNLDTSGSNEDALDEFMSKLKSAAILNKSDITNLKVQLVKLRKEETQLSKLIEISKPANLPALKPQGSNSGAIGTKSKSIIKSFKQEKAVKESKVPETDEKPKSKEEENSDDKIESNAQKLKESNKKLADEVTDDISNIPNKIMKRNKEKSETREQSTESAETVSMQEGEEGKSNDELKEKNSETDEEILKRKKRNMKRTQHRSMKLEKDKMKSYEEETYDDDYCTWVPPEGQSGDGKTALNEKFGY